ncbi:AzlD domain-containing protein [Salipiger marinus]|uniref:AzlD domain-containing protein n=1 Tax=Salipiger marinus TaxID=555512 RepID=UPI004058494C
MIDTTTFWTLTALLGVGTFLVRFSFLGFLGGRQLPDWFVLHLKYVGVGVLPAMVTPLVLWPAATGAKPIPPGSSRPSPPSSSPSGCRWRVRWWREWARFT